MQKGTVVSFKCIDQLSQNSAREHNLVNSFEQNRTKSNFSILLFPLYSVVFLLIFSCANFNPI